MTDDELRQLTQGFEDAWNAHDMDRFGILFHDDASFVNRFATYWRGRKAIVEGHRTIHATVYADSTLAIDLPDVDRIGPDVAILHFWTRLSAGARHPAGPHQSDTLVMAVVTRREGKMAFQAAENVTYTDPRTGGDLLRDR